MNAGNRAKDLVRQILTFSRQTEQELKPVLVKSIVKEALKLLRATLPTSIHIDHDIKSDSLVMGDPTQIHQILMNLCTNAGQAMQEKGGVLGVELTDTELDSVFTSRHPDLKPGPYLSLTVSDTGHGISPDIMDRIFDPFFTTKESGKGTGMGLSVVHGIVKSYGGTVYAYSELEKGSSFKIFLPVISSSQKQDEKIEMVVPHGTERILFIDDEPALVEMVKQTLKGLGYQVVIRTSSVEALNLFRAQPDRFDLVITDMTMPQMTGDKLAAALIAIRKDIPIILCTGFSYGMTEDRVKEIGVKGFLMKPFLFRDLANNVRKVLDEK
jgi:CheY-like chemotaxis protein